MDKTDKFVIISGAMFIILVWMVATENGRQKSQQPLTIGDEQAQAQHIMELQSRICKLEHNEDNCVWNYEK